MKPWKFIVFIFLSLFLAACGGETVTPTPIPPAPTQAISAGEATATTAVLPATSTPLPLPPTMAAPATATLVATATPLPTPEGVFLLNPADFGTDRNPLTGELISDPSLLQRRPIAIKVSNGPPLYVRPQSGLSQADIVFEHTSEWNVTRFTAIFYSQTPPKVGPIRSARLIDVELPAMYDAALAYSGSSTGVSSLLFGSDFAQRILRSNEPGYFRSGETDKPYEHTLYGNPAQFWDDLTEKGLNVAPAFTSHMAFASETPAGGTPASTAIVDYDYTISEWRYDAEIGRYRRWADGEEHIDANTGEQLTAENIVIISPFHVLDPNICEEAHDGKCVHLSVQIQIWGTGTGLVLRDGQQFPVTWHRENRSDMLTFTDANGNPFPLQIGNTWVQLVPSWLENPVTITP